MTQTTHLPRDCRICRRCTAPLSDVRVRLLDEVEYENGQGRQPSKADLTRSEPARTRANHYSVLDELMHAGLLVNEAGPCRNRPGYVAWRYALRITDAGLAALNASVAR